LLSTDAHCLVIILGGNAMWSIFREAASHGQSALADIFYSGRNLEGMSLLCSDGKRALGRIICQIMELQ